MSIPAPVSLAWLFDGIAGLPANDATVAELTLDSREVRAGTLFLAVNGHQSHGLRFAAEAVSRGASAVLWEPDGAEVSAVPDAPGLDVAGLDAALEGVAIASARPVFFAAVPGLRGLLGRIADRFFGSPSAQLRVIGITGTNGKTTCAYLLAQCLDRLNLPAAYIGTIGWGRIDALQVPTHTTPDVITLHRQLAALLADGVGAVALEVSSHALDQGRVDGVRFHVAAFTNLTRDHLDYHGSMEAYGAAKARLFSVPGLQHAVINVGDGFGRALAASLDGDMSTTAVWVGAAEPGGGGDDASGGAHVGAVAGVRRAPLHTVHADRVEIDRQGIRLDVGGSFGVCRVATRLLGRFNAENGIVVLGCLTSLGWDLERASVALAACQAPPGRMEVIEAPNGGKPVAVVDYAHTPDALGKALAALREHCPGDLWCVFGCGGDRDPGKRPLMGAVVDAAADRIIVTDDNPRSEDPAQITQAIVLGIMRHASRVIHDRGTAIATALDEAAASDVVLIAGKGHEDYQIYGATRRRFSDRDAALRSLGVAA